MQLTAVARQCPYSNAKEINVPQAAKAKAPAAAAEKKKQQKNPRRVSNDFPRVSC